MPASKKEVPTEGEIEKSIAPISEALSKSVKEIWKMFVMRYIAKAVGEIFLAGCTVGLTFYYLGGHKMWQLLPLSIAAVFIFDAIQLLLNPYYFAMNDVAVRLKSEQLLWKK